MKLRKQMAAAVLAAAALSLSLPLSQAQDTPSPDHMLGLTAEQRMEDYKYLWSVLADSYPCWGILDREGVDVEGIYTSYRDMVAESDSDQTFYQAVYSTLFLLGNNGHLSIVEPADYFSLLPSARLYRRSGQTAWADILERKETREKYRSLLALDRAIDSSSEEEEPALETPAPAAGGVIPLLLPESGVGYVKIDSFPAEYEADRAILSDFYRQCGDCTDLIFDLTDNSGGSEAYWEELLVAPHIDEPLSSEHLALVRHSRNNAPYLDQVFPAECLLPLNQLPSLPHLEPGDLDLATHFVRVCHRVEPADRAQPLPGPHLGPGRRVRLLRLRILRPLLPTDRFCHAGGQCHQRRRHRDRPGLSPAAQQRDLGPVHPCIRPQSRREQQRGAGHPPRPPLSPRRASSYHRSPGHLSGLSHLSPSASRAGT